MLLIGLITIVGLEEIKQRKKAVYAGVNGRLTSHESVQKELF
jgi:hypothetical protein